jgi:hypothetical protein
MQRSVLFGKRRFGDQGTGDVTLLADANRIVSALSTFGLPVVNSFK